MRSKYLLMVSPEKWTLSQRERAEILFELYPDIEMAYSLTHSLRMIFAQKCDKEAGRKSIKKWYAKVGEFDNKAFNDIAICSLPSGGTLHDVINIADSSLIFTMHRKVLA